MTTNIQLLRSSIPYKRPSAAPLLEGQAAINYNSAEPGLYFRLTDGKLAKVGPVAVNDNAVAPNAAPAGETGNAVGETWLDARPTYYSPILKVYDGNSWVTSNGFTVEDSSGNLTLDRCLTVNCFTTGELEVDGPAVIGGNITPNGQNCAYYVGKPNERWDFFFGCNLDISNDGLISNDLLVGRDGVITRDLTVGRHVVSNLTPDVTATRFLGDPSQRWANVYSNGLDVSGSATIGSGCGTSTINLNAATTLSCDMMPDATNTRSIGSDTLRLKEVYATDVYTGDLHLKNEKGDWTMIEDENYLTIRNNKNGKTFRLLMEEV